MDTPTTAYHSVGCAFGRTTSWEVGNFQLLWTVSRPSKASTTTEHKFTAAAKLFSTEHSLRANAKPLSTPLSQPAVSIRWACACLPLSRLSLRGPGAAPVPHTVQPPIVKRRKIRMAGGCANPRSNGGHGWDRVPGQVKHEAVDPRKVQKYAGYFCPTRRHTEYAEDWAGLVCLESLVLVGRARVVLDTGHWTLVPPHHPPEHGTTHPAWMWIAAVALARTATQDPCRCSVIQAETICRVPLPNQDAGAFVNGAMARSPQP